MGIFNSNYSKPGPGIDKNAPKKKGLNLFYDIFFRKFWDIIKLNLLYFVTIIPHFLIIMLIAGVISNGIIENAAPTVAKVFGMQAPDVNNVEFSKAIMFIDIGIRLITAFAYTVFFGAGPMTAGFIYILRAFINEQPVFMVSDYFKVVKDNIKQSLALWVIDIVIFAFAAYASGFYGGMPAPMSYMKYILYMLLFFYTTLHFFIYHLMISYKMPFHQLFRNSALFVIPSFPYALMVFGLCAFFVFIFPGITFTSPSEAIIRIFGSLMVILWICLLFGICGMITEFNACMQVRKYIKEDHGVEEKKNIHSR